MSDPSPESDRARQAQNGHSNEAVIHTAAGSPTEGLDDAHANPEDPDEVDTWTGRVIPPQEKTFIAIVKKAQRDRATGNPSARTQRKAALAASGILKLDRWIGVLKHMPADGDGNISVRIEIAPDILVETDFEIAPGSPTFNLINPLMYGTIMEFSGSFVLDPKDYFKETSLTEGGGLSEPEWLFHLDSIKALD